MPWISWPARRSSRRGISGTSTVLPLVLSHIIFPLFFLVVFSVYLFRSVYSCDKPTDLLVYLSSYYPSHLCDNSTCFFFHNPEFIRIESPMIMLVDHARETTSCRERLGAKPGDLVAIKTHQWFAGFDWGGVQAGECSNQVRAMGQIGERTDRGATG